MKFPRSSRPPVAAVALTGAASLAALVVAMGWAPARSGPNCRVDCIVYPYTDGAAYVPVEYWWMYPAIVVPLAFAWFLIALRAAGRGRRVTADLAVLAASLSSGFMGAAYGIQLFMLEPSMLKGETAGLELWSMYNPHGIFIALENMGYLCLAAAMLLSARLMNGGARWWAGVWGGAGILALPILAVALGSNLEYNYEVASILTCWIGLIGLVPFVMAREARGMREALEAGEPREPREAGEAGEPREPREGGEPREAGEPREVRGRRSTHATAS